MNDLLLEINLDEKNHKILQVELVEQIKENVLILSVLELLPESLVVDDLPVGPDFVQGHVLQVLGVVAVRRDEEVGNELTSDILGLHLEAEHIHEGRHVVLVGHVGDHLHVHVVFRQIASVDEVDHRGESDLVHILDVDLSLPGLLHVSEDHGSKHRGSEPEEIIN